MADLELRQLAESGLKNSQELFRIAALCRTRGEQTGQARYSILADLFSWLAESWDEYGALSDELARKINELLSLRLPEVLEAAAPELGSRIAESLRRDIHEEFSRRRL